MFGRNFKSLALFTFVIITAVSQGFAVNLAQGEYSVVNGSFEDSNSFAQSNWLPYIGGAGGTITVNTDPNKSYYGRKSIALYRQSGDTVAFQEINLVTSGNGPRRGDLVEGGAWVMLDSTAASDPTGQVVVQMKYVIGSTPYVITGSANIQNKQANKWYYLLTYAANPVIPQNAEKIQIVVDSWLNGTVYVDFAQCGKVGSITGNPSKLAMAEYQTWFAEPNYLPDWRRFTDTTYTGFADYNVHNWQHWQWGWQPDAGYNSDPGLHKIIGIKAGRNYSFLNPSFEQGGYGDWNEPGWRRWPENAYNSITTEKAYDGTHSVKLTNQYAGSNECLLRQWIPCKDILHPQDDAPNEKEMISASVWVNFGDINDINLAGGNFWIEVTAKHDPDYNPSTQNDVNTLIAKSYEHISPEYVKEHSTPSGWVKISTQPVNKAVIPWWTYGLEVSVHFFYAGTIYVDKVEVGEAELSNTQRQIACDKTPIIGPYDSNDDGVIGYHLGLCKSMLLDAMLINYYGNQYKQEKYQTIIFGKIADQAENKDMKVCVFYEPKVHLKKWGDVNYCDNIRNVSGMNAADRARVNAYIDNVTPYTDVSQISDFNVVKHYIKMAAVQSDIKYVLDTWGSRKSYLAFRGKPVIGIFGIYSSKYDDGMTEQDWKDIYDNLTVHDGNYKFIFIGDSVPADGAAGWFDCFGGMMNWYLVDEIIRDRNHPSENAIYQRSRDVVNGRTISWAQAGANRFAIGMTYPQFNDQGVGAWGPIDTHQVDPYGNKVYRYYVNRTPVWNGKFYKMNNNGLMTDANDINWLVVATFNDWNEGTSIEPSVEDGYLYPIITQNFIEKFKGCAAVDDGKMQQITEKYIDTRVKMDVDTSIDKKQSDPADLHTYYKLLIYQFDSSGNYLGELPLIDWSCSKGRFTSNFAGHSANLAFYEPCIRISTQSGKGWVKIDGMSTTAWSESFNSVTNWLAFEGATISSASSVAMIKDSTDGCGGARWISARVPYTSGDVMTLDVNNVYTYGSGKYYSGAACMKMALDYEGFNSYTQDQLHNYAAAHNELTDQNSCIDPRGMYLGMNNFEIDTDYNYGTELMSSLVSAYDMICYWMSYSIPNVSPRPEKMPAIIPLNGNYMDWVIVNGYDTTDDPWTAGSYTVNGFWITDPQVNGLGKNFYITAYDLGNYYRPIVSDDSYNGYYVAVCEPPAANEAEVTIAMPKTFAGFKANNKCVVEAAIAGINSVPNDQQFKSAYVDSQPGKPILVDNGKERYYIVPFIKNSGCSAAVIIDAKSGALRQASYSDTPDGKYLTSLKNQKKAKAGSRKSKNAFLPDSENIK